MARPVFAFAMRGAEIERYSVLPRALDPVRLFRPRDSEPENERRMLETLHTERGLALTWCRLSTFPTRSWTRAPRDGGTFVHLGFSRILHEGGALG
ncbi:hypothetical protein [Streptomyces sp. NPDC057939]|uniref:hypothetical protein n=1 Tax=Streptomyces sp. NPDC057939 TaxID=3346284 RepID=UPI0036E1AE2D